LAASCVFSFYGLFLAFVTCALFPHPDLPLPWSRGPTLPSSFHIAAKLARLPNPQALFFMMPFLSVLDFLPIVPMLRTEFDDVSPGFSCARVIAEGTGAAKSGLDSLWSSPSYLFPEKVGRLLAWLSLPGKLVKKSRRPPGWRSGARLFVCFSLQTSLRPFHRAGAFQTTPKPDREASLFRRSWVRPCRFPREFRIIAAFFSFSFPMLPPFEKVLFFRT